MKSLIVGFGEIGKSLFNILHEHYEVFTKDIGDMNSVGNFDIIHICFGYSDRFVDQVQKYQEEYKPKYTVIHSTVPVGTCRKLKAIHSPVIGQHPFLEEGIRNFPKMLGGDQGSEVADYFRRVGIKVVLFDQPETTEAAKLFLTEYYRECIEFTQRVKTYCDLHNLNFSEVYRIPNQIYNEGYKKLGFEEFTRPILQPIMGTIGGHCVGPNSKLIKFNE